MGTGYVRNDTANNIADGNIINASDLDGEFDAVQSAFDASTGHTHDGTAGEGAPIETIGPTQDVVATASVLRPKTDNTVDLGTTTLEYKDLFLDGTAHIDTLDVDENASITGTLGVTGATTLSSTLGVTGATTLSSTLGVTGAVTLSSTLGVTGAATLSSTLAVTGATGIDGDFDINTNKFTVASTTGNTAVAGTLGVTGATTLSSTLGVTGTTTLGTANITTADINGGNIDGTIIGATTAAAITGTTITGTSFVTSGDMTFGDNDKAIFGAGSDLQIYHSGADSFIREVGTGDLILAGNNLSLRNAETTEVYLSATTNGEVSLRYDNAAKLSTTSTGIDVTGTVSIDDTGGTYRGGVGLASSLVSGGASTNIGVQAQGLLSFATGGITERMRIDSSGNVGIGTSSPSEKLHVNNGAIVAGNNSDVLIGRYDSSFPSVGEGYFKIRTNNAGATTGGISFETLNSGTLTERMRIDSSGIVKIGTTGDPWSSGTGTAIFQAGEIDIVSSAGVPLYLKRRSSDGQIIQFHRDNTQVGSISVTASSTSYNTSSDYRLKEDWQPMSGSIDRLKALNPVNFAWKADGSRVDGFLAHEAAEVVPEAVSGEKDAVEAIGNITDAEGTVVQENVLEPAELAEGQTWTKTEDRPVYQGIDQAKLVPLLTAALQEAVAKIEALETRIAALESN